jgi:hypothetical protein
LNPQFQNRFQSEVLIRAKIKKLLKKYAIKPSIVRFDNLNENHNHQFQLFQFVLALDKLVQNLSPSLLGEFQEVSRSFDTSPNFTLDDDTKAEIVDAIDKSGWDLVGPDFFEFLG